jgi:hypothetical protein
MDGPKDKRVPGQPGAAAEGFFLRDWSPRRSYFSPKNFPAEPPSREKNEGGTAVPAVKDTSPRIHANPRE